MSTELELAPPIEVVETTDDDFDIPEMVAHLYHGNPFVPPETTLCGIPVGQDAHDRMHKVERLHPGQWNPGQMECSCGAPCCEKCYALAMKVAGQ